MTIIVPVAVALRGLFARIRRSIGAAVVTEALAVKPKLWPMTPAAQTIWAIRLRPGLQQIAAAALQSSDSLQAFLLQSRPPEWRSMNSPGGIRTCDQSVNSRPLYR
jgi:hypothetical protein